MFCWRMAVDVVFFEGEDWLCLFFLWRVQSMKGVLVVQESISVRYGRCCQSLEFPLVSTTSVGQL